MPAPVRIWLEISHHTAFRVGGWAFVRHDGAVLSGQAGGDRRLDAEATALKALAAALAQAAPAGATVRILTASRLVAAIPERIRAAEAGEAAPEENLPLWAQAMRALSAAPVELAAADPGARPTAFAAAWAELGRDRAKDNGPFASAIPKPNLAKSGVAG